MKNYRPIAILSNFANVYEHVLYAAVFSGIAPLVSPHQHQFLLRTSTITDLVAITHFISEQLD